METNQLRDSSRSRNRKKVWNPFAISYLAKIKN
jgi:hypothetical protein